MLHSNFLFYFYVLPTLDENSIVRSRNDHKYNAEPKIACNLSLPITKLYKLRAAHPLSAHAALATAPSLILNTH